MCPVRLPTKCNFGRFYNYGISFWDLWFLASPKGHCSVNYSLSVVYFRIYSNTLSLQELYIFILQYTITRTPAIANGSRVRRCKDVCRQSLTIWAVLSNVWFFCRFFRYDMLHCTVSIPF